MAFVFAYSNLVCAKPLFFEMPLSLSSHAFNQDSQGQDSQPLSDAIEHEESISKERNHTSDGNGFLESPTARKRIARNAHPCVSKVVREFDSCRNLWVDKVECKGRHPACNYVIPKHNIAKCRTVYGFRNAMFANKCSALPIDCQCAY